MSCKAECEEVTLRVIKLPLQGMESSVPDAEPWLPRVQLVRARGAGCVTWDLLEHC